MNIFVYLRTRISPLLAGITGPGGSAERRPNLTLEIDTHQVLDCTDLLCPMPVVKTSKAIKTIEIGQVLQMIATDPGAPPDMEAWVRQTGHEMVAQTVDDGKFIFWFRRTH
jgi:tRNA 2-thiouridine synthesizing protein A